MIFRHCRIKVLHFTFRQSVKSREKEIGKFISSLLSLLLYGELFDRRAESSCGWQTIRTTIRITEIAINLLVCQSVGQIRSLANPRFQWDDLTGLS